MKITDKRIIEFLKKKHGENFDIDGFVNVSIDRLRDANKFSDIGKTVFLTREEAEAEFNGFLMIRKTYHEDCMLKKAYEAIRNGEKTYDGILRFAANKGFTKSEILEIMEEQK